MTLALHGKSKKRQAGLLFGGFTAAIFAVLLAVTMDFGGQPAFADTTVPLHSDHVGSTNPPSAGDPGLGACPAPPAGQEGWYGWHFVLPANANFASLTVTFQNAGVKSANPFPGTTFVAHPDNSHAYVWTPTPDTLLSGSATTASASPPDKFNLSHVCAGSAVPAPVVEIDKSDTGDGSYAIGEEFIYRITATVSGSQTAQDLFITDDIDDDLQVVSVTSNSASIINCTGAGVDPVTCELNQGASIGVHTVDIKVKAKAGASCGEVPNIAVLRSGNITGPEIDSESESVDITGCGSLTIDKSDTAQFSGTAPTLLTWTVTINNSGPATTAFVYDPFGTLTAESCTNALSLPLISAPFQCDVPGAGPGPEVTLTFTTAHDLTRQEFCDGSQWQNTVYLVSSVSDTITAGDPSDSGTGTISGRADARCITVAKTNVSEGVWNITFTNIGPTADVNFSDSYEEGFTNTDILSVFDGAVPVSCEQVTPDFWRGCNTSIPADQTKVITVNTGQITGACEQQTVGNNVSAFFGTGNPQGTQLQITPGGDFGAAYHEPIDQVACGRVIELCKVWQPNGALNGASTFLFTGSDTSQEIPATQPLSIPGVVEGDADGECILVSVSIGLVNFTETVPPGFLTPTWALGHGVGGNTLGSGSGNFVQFHTAECSIAPEEAVTSLLRAILSLVVEVETPILPVCTVTFFNTDDGQTASNGAIRIEKYVDINGDGDANDVALGEGPYGGWPMTTLGPDVNETTGTWGFPDENFGSITYEGLTTGDIYSITEGAVAGYAVTNATINGISQGAVTSVGAVVPNGGFTVVQFFNQPKGAILVHKVAVTSHNGSGDVNAPNDDDGWTITVSSANCGVNIVKQTDANGDALFEGLPLCTDYVITESPNNPLSPGFVVVGSASFTGVTPTLQGATALTFLNRKTTFDPPCTDCRQATPPTPTATPPTPVVTTTPTTPEASPTTPVTNVEGERTPGASPTPIAPSTGGGLMGGTAGGFNILLILAGLIALTSGLGAVALGRKRN